MRCTIEQSNAIDWLPPDGIGIDLTVTSPPYNVGIDYNLVDDSGDYDSYLSFCKAWLDNLFRITSFTGRLCLNIPLDRNKGGHCSVCADIVTIAKQIGWKYQGTIIWNKRTIPNRTAWGSWMSASAPHVIAQVEVIVVLYKGEWKRDRAGVTTISREEFISWTNGMWEFIGEKSKKVNHPAAFPEELPKRCIKLFSYEDDVIFDPFLGSGTTCVVAEVLERKSFGIDIDSVYVEGALRRVKERVGKLL